MTDEFRREFEAAGLARYADLFAQEEVIVTNLSICSAISYCASRLLPCLSALVATASRRRSVHCWLRVTVRSLLFAWVWYSPRCR